MLITIAKSEKNAMQYAAAVCELDVEFFTVESTRTDKPQMLRAEVTDKTKEDKEPSPERSWYLARMMENKLEMERLSKKY